jgi:hypothetical protein
VAPPEFPPPFVIERTRTLGFGTGPWTRDRLVDAWGAPTADKYIGEAKAAGWLVSPSRGVYHVPSAQDIMLVSWLAEPARSEFLISRTLSAANIRAWCMSAWCRDNGLDFAEPVFVTDLSQPTQASRAAPDRRNLQAVAAQLAAKRTTIPFLDNLLIVPAVPTLSAPIPRVALVPEAEEALDRRRVETQVGQAAMAIAGLILYAVDKSPPDDILAEFGKLQSREAAARGIPYAVDGAIPDDAWITALLASIGTSRIEELVTKKLRPKMKGRGEQIQRWASLLGPPQPVAMWNDTLRNGPFPYLLVPPSLWSEMGADQAARRYKMLEQLAKA